jgi:hypothetical protein
MQEGLTVYVMLVYSEIGVHPPTPSQASGERTKWGTQQDVKFY